MNQVAFVYQSKGKSITGAHIYEDDLLKAINNTPNVSAKIITAPSAKNKWLKLFAPLRNLKLLNTLQSYGLLVLNSSKAHYFIPLLLCLNKKKIKNLIIHHHFQYLSFTGIKRSLFKAIEIFYLKNAYKVLTPSPYIAEELRRLYGIDSLICEIPFETRIDKTALKPHPGKLLYIGTIEERKGLIYLIKALEVLKKRKIEVSLDIVGKCVDSEYNRLLSETIGKLQLDNIKFHGFIEASAMSELKRNADIFVFPSLLEGFGMALNEAMAFGLPVVCFNNTAMPFSVKNGENGILVENKSVEGLADAIAGIVTDREQRKRLSSGALEWASHLPTKQEFNHKAASIIQNLLNNS